MKRILEEFYFENIQPNSKQFVHGTNFEKAMHILSDNEAKLSELLSGKEKLLFLDLCNAWSEVNGTTAVEKFISGFQIGAQIGIAIYNDDSSCFREME